MSTLSCANFTELTELTVSVYMCLFQLPHPTPSIFTFPDEAPISVAPSLSVFSPGGTGLSVSPGSPGVNTTQPQAPSLSPSRGYCPVVRGLSLTSPVTESGGGLSIPNVTSTARSPSVNRLGSLFNSINRSVTSAFSTFVVVNQPVPGVIQHHDQTPPPPSLQRQQSQPRFFGGTPPSRRGSSQQQVTTQQVHHTSTIGS